MAVVLKILSHVQFELFEKNRQITNTWPFGLRLALNRFCGRAMNRVSATRFRYSARGILTRFGYARRRTALLHDMRQFVGEKRLPRARPGRKPTYPKGDVMPRRISIRVNVLSRLSGRRIRMHPHPGKIVTEALLHVMPQRRFQRAA